MTTDYRNTTLWKAAFCGTGLTKAERSAREKLKVALNDLETHVSDILTKIPPDCRGLTVHDIRHIHQLWDVASTICGRKYPVNPLEGFVLGAAFLIHDAGLTAAAYPGGIEGIRQTQFYQDMLATELKRDDPNQGFMEQAAVPKETHDKILFAFLRSVHAERALNLLNQAYIHPITRHGWTLISSELLLDVGMIVGKIAASHHWDIGRVSREFGDPLSPPAAFRGWPIDALKLACILRCADACAIDERRAPVMAFILENPRGVSRDHWAFQSYLKPGHLPLSQEGLIFQSKRPMKREDMDAWWLAYEGIMLADRELRDSDRLFKYRAGQGDRRKEIPLAAKRVEGSGDASLLSRYVTVEGWAPVDTAVRISDPMVLVEQFGGKQLYGNDHSAPIRELIQNAADAVRARRRRPNGYGRNEGDNAGRIQISIEKLDHSWLMRISDDGIGMPGEVLTGAFIEFGKSLWRSDKLSSLYPGLASDPDFNPTGQFGIGFYATFMIGEDVKIMSKPYNGGDENRKVLHFRKGVRSRAEFRDYDADLDGNWPFALSTVIEIKFDSDEWISQFARISFHGYFDGPIYSDNIRY